MAEAKSDTQSIINAQVNELSEDELKAIIANVNELAEPAEEDLIIKEAANNKLQEMKSIDELSPLTIGLGILGFGLMFSAFVMLFTGFSDESTLTFGAGLLLIMIVKLFTKL